MSHDYKQLPCFYVTICALLLGFDGLPFSSAGETSNLLASEQFKTIVLALYEEDKRQQVGYEDLPKILAMDVRSEKTVVRSVEFALALKKYNDAIMLIDYGLSIFPDNALLWGYRGSALRYRQNRPKNELDDFKQAEMAFSKAIKLDPTLGAGCIWACRAELYYRLKQNKEAIRDMAECIKRSKDDMSHLVFYAQLLGEDKQFTNAKTIATEALKCKGNKAFPNITLGWLHKCEGEEELANKYFAEARKIDSSKEISNLITDTIRRADEYLLGRITIQLRE